MPTMDNVQATTSDDIQRQISPDSQLPNQNRTGQPAISDQPLWWQTDNSDVNTTSPMQSTSR